MKNQNKNKMDKSNFRFLCNLLENELKGGPKKVLDFGCGEGEFIEYANKANIICDGADTFSGMYSVWEDMAINRLTKSNSIYKIIGGRIPIKDNTYDIVVSNQVIEHISNPLESLAEISRILKPGGKFIALFPVFETLFEPHARLYFIHYIGNRKLQFWTIFLMNKLGFGNRAFNNSSFENAKEMQHILMNYCFHHKSRTITKILNNTFNNKVENINYLYAKHKILTENSKLISKIFPMIKPVLSILVLLRAGLAIKVSNNKELLNDNSIRL